MSEDDGKIDPTVDSNKAGESDVSPPVTFPMAPSRIPKQIGKFRIKKLIATGGMGAVYQGVQEQPRRTVAIKLMKSGVTSASALRRFEYESQLLARLRHPGIAEVYDAGTHEARDGSVPYFVMEFIAGAKRITDYVQYKKLATRERLKLFIEAAAAVHHGHTKGIIHRDLKPDNMLVNSHGRVKVIDFGVARATDSDLAVTNLQTDIGQLIGTVQYMSPEQVEAEPDDLDTRSDVYSLGVILYEVLCGNLPYDVRKLKVYDATRVVRETEAMKLSTVDSTLRGDIETIVAKALEKDRDRRYQSAKELADDIQRYLSDEAIMARPPSITYQMRVFARRNKGVMTGVAAVFGALLLGLAGMSWLYVDTERERQNAEVATENAVAAETQARQDRDAARVATSEAKDLAKQLQDEIKEGVRNLYATQMIAAGLAVENSSGLARVRDLTDNWLPQPGKEDLRGWEWYYLRGQLNQETHSFPGSHIAHWTHDGVRLGYLNREDGSYTVKDDTGDVRGVKPVAEIRLIDPACGTGHFLVAAFDLLYDMYLEEGRTDDPETICRSILANNLFGLDIDARAVAIADFVLRARAAERCGRTVDAGANLAAINVRLDDHERQLREHLERNPDDRAVEPALAELFAGFARADELGSLLRVEALSGADGERLPRLSGAAPGRPDGAAVCALLTQRYDVVVTNPPYLGLTNLGTRTKAWLRRHYPDSRSDLLAAFVTRCLELAREDGTAAMVTRKVWMFLESHAALRRRVLGESTLEVLCDLGPKAFGAESNLHDGVTSALFVLRKRAPAADHELLALDAVAPRDPAGKSRLVVRLAREDPQGAGDLTTKVRQADLSALPGSVCVTSLPERAYAVLCGESRLRDHAAVHQGLSPGDTRRFVRYHFEVPHTRDWPPFPKGGGYRRWFGRNRFVLDWRRGGEPIRQMPGGRVQNTAYYFHDGYTYPTTAGPCPTLALYRLQRVLAAGRNRSVSRKSRDKSRTDGPRKLHRWRPGHHPRSARRAHSGIGRAVV